MRKIERGDALWDFEAKWTAPNGTPQELVKQQAERITLSQYWQYDLAVVVKYKY
jgi:hypothetical protein